MNPVSCISITPLLPTALYYLQQSNLNPSSIVCQPPKEMFTDTCDHSEASREISWSYRHWSPFSLCNIWQFSSQQHLCFQDDKVVIHLRNPTVKWKNTLIVLECTQFSTYYIMTNKFYLPLNFSSNVHFNKNKTTKGNPVFAMQGRCPQSQIYIWPRENREKTDRKEGREGEGEEGK